MLATLEQSGLRFAVLVLPSVEAQVVQLVGAEVASQLKLVASEPDLVSWSLLPADPRHWQRT